MGVGAGGWGVSGEGLGDHESIVYIKGQSYDISCQNCNML